MSDKIYAAVCVNWTEHEPGWGSRPDGHTLHLTMSDAKVYVERVMVKNRDASGDYSTPGKPFFVPVDENTREELKNTEGKTIWGHVSQYYYLED